MVTIVPNYKVGFNFSRGLKWIQEFQAVVSNTLSDPSISEVKLFSGNNIISFNANNIALIIIPPNNNTVQITVKANAVDVGFNIHNTNPLVLTKERAGGPTDIVFVAAADIDDVRVVQF